jgi:hypothetical protein
MDCQRTGGVFFADARAIHFAQARAAESGCVATEDGSGEFESPCRGTPLCSAAPAVGTSRRVVKSASNGRERMGEILRMTRRCRAIRNAAKLGHGRPAA